MDVVFAVLPFADVARPAIGVSLLKAGLERRGFSAAVEYLNILLAELIGEPLYTRLSDSLSSESLVGEWFFADTVFDGGLPHEQEYVGRVLSRFADQTVIDGVLAARPVRHDFVDRCVETIARRRARVVGFTTTFHQTVPCLAVAKRLKQMADPPIVVFGGANCEGEMGLQLLMSFPWIDYVCTREGDHAFPLFIERLLRGGDASAIPGILRRGESTAVSVPDVVEDLDALPLPDYHEYFARVRASPLAAEITPELLVETSRGCWWGAKHHCTFCGLNGDTMGFRSKSPGRVLSELETLSRTYGVQKINCVDNILDMRYLDSVFPRLAERELGLELFYEVKANLKYEHLAVMHAGGVRAIQPGIESFSDTVLRLMRKGCTGAQNVQLLRWCEELGIVVAWNILGGFPAEPVSEYERMADLVPLLMHLPPPTSCFQIRLDRFSPYFTDALRHGLRRIRPNPAYYYVYPLGRRELARLAYFFDFDYPDGRKPDDYLGPLKRAVAGWWQARVGDRDRRPRLDARVMPNGEVVITDTRPCAVDPEHRLGGLAADLYLQCDAAQTVNGLARRLGARTDTAEIGSVLEDLARRKLVAGIDGHHVSLAVFRNRQDWHVPEERHGASLAPTSAVAEPLLRLL